MRKINILRDYYEELENALKFQNYLEDREEDMKIEYISILGAFMARIRTKNGIYHGHGQTKNQALRSALNYMAAVE